MATRHASTDTTSAAFGARTIQTLIRLLPFPPVLYTARFIDPIKTGFAALTTNKEPAIRTQPSGPAAGPFA